MLALDIQTFTYEDRHDLLPRLTAALGKCGGWVLERRNVSPTQLEFSVEIPLRAAVDLYGSLLGEGVELTRGAHEGLTDLCTRRKHVRHLAELGQVVALHLELTFLDDMTLHDVLLTGAGAA
ncbi:MAG TPA: hypothetical protein VG714_06305 [Acidobacteriaceae bacterium]|nr:hypothetical protein [Acidobacteriaceae bacterium]